MILHRLGWRRRINDRNTLLVVGFTFQSRQFVFEYDNLVGIGVDTYSVGGNEDKDRKRADASSL
jgi:hypothetical protein